MTRKTHDGVGAGGPCEGGGVAVSGHCGGCGCTGPGKGKLQLQPGGAVWCLLCPKYKTLLLNQNLHEAICLPSQCLGEKLGWPDKRPDAKGAGHRAQLRS